MLRPEIAPSIRAVIVPPGFQTAPVLQALQDTQALHELHMQQQSARIAALEASLRHEIEQRERAEATLKSAEETIAGLAARLRPSVFIKQDLVGTITVDGDDYLCGFAYANDVGEPLRLELREIWAVGAVNISDYAPADLSIACEVAAEKIQTEMAQDMRDELAIDAYEFERGY